jgi:hypothetical protein
MARKRIHKSNDGGIERVHEYFKYLTAVGGKTLVTTESQHNIGKIIALSMIAHNYVVSRTESGIADKMSTFANLAFFHFGF